MPSVTSVQRLPPEAQSRPASRGRHLARPLPPPCDTAAGPEQAPGGAPRPRARRSLFPRVSAVAGGGEGNAGVAAAQGPLCPSRCNAFGPWPCGGAGAFASSGGWGVPLSSSGEDPYASSGILRASRFFPKQSAGCSRVLLPFTSEGCITQLRGCVAASPERRFRVATVVGCRWALSSAPGTGRAVQ